MRSIRDIFKIGRGPSSSHTMGPERACLLFRAEHPEAARFEAVLYGSLARTGAGHGTDRVIRESFAPLECEIRLELNSDDLPHPNTMELIAREPDGAVCGRMRVFSVGGGDIQIEGRAAEPEALHVYPHTHFADIAAHCKAQNIRLSDYVEACEGVEIWDFLRKVWAQMRASIDDGLRRGGVLPGGLGVERKARLLYEQRPARERPETREDRIVCAYAYAVSEQNADSGTVVTAPTCGSCGVLPAVLRYMQKHERRSEDEVLRALAVAGLIGNLVKRNASISGAECGCQAEIGTACSMAAAALAELDGMEIDQIEYAAEVALEHHLGLTCDPIGGLVQIPCIERNAVAAMRAINAVRISTFLTATRKISFDLVVETMYETGRDLNRIYRETAEGGLAKLYK